MKDGMNPKDSNYRWITGQGAAFGAPGMEPRWTSSRKDAVGTAYASSSRVWFTVSHGVLNEIYYPTIDRPQVRDMEFLFTDGETFFHEEKRHLQHEFEYIDADALGVRVMERDPMGRYMMTKEIVCDPHHPIVLQHVRITGDEAVLSRMKAYALLAPHLEVGGAGNSGRGLEVAGLKALLCWKNQTSLAMGVDCGFTRTSCGFAGESDGWQDLSKNMKMDWEFGEALNGNIAVMGEIDLSRVREFTVAISLGEGHHAALSGMMQSLAMPFDAHCKRFVEQWHRAESPERLALRSTDGGRLMRISHNIILAHEDKTYSGAFIASASIPWGRSKGDDDLGGYHLVWTRDMVQSATALLACGRVETARRALVYLACTQKPDGGFAQNFWIDGTPYWTGIQLDEVAFPIVLAWRLWKLGGLGDFDVFPFVERAAGFLVQYAPVTQQERWEENAGYSPSTLAAVITGLLCAADIARSHMAPEMAGFLEDFADWLEAHLDEWTTTEDGVLLPEVKRHYIRIRPPQEGDPFQTETNSKHNIVRLNNRAPGEKFEYEAREIIDGGFLELVRYGIRRADDPLVVDTLKVVDAVLRIETPYGPCWRRYNHDGYGQRKDGGPFLTWGQGRAWPLLTGERAHYELARGNDITLLIKAMERFSSSGGMMPEQIWDYADMPETGMYFGRSAGSAQPLVWAHAEYIKLLRSAADDCVYDRIPIVYDRYAGAGKDKPQRRLVEIYQLSRTLDTVAEGHILRILDAKRFRVVWSDNGWAASHVVESSAVGYMGFHVDLPPAQAAGEGRSGVIEFSIYWLDENRWLDHNKSVKVETGSAVPPILDTARIGQ
jgi:glucoamylase